AIVQKGSRLKDFIDVYYLLEKIPFGLLSKAYCQKYPNATPQMAHSGLLYHADIDFSVPVTMLKSKLDWAIINDRLRNAVLKNHWSVFEQDQPKEQTRQKGVDASDYNVLALSIYIPYFGRSLPRDTSFQSIKCAHA